MGFSAIAVYTLASGILVPFLAIALALWTRRSKAQLALLAIAAAALLASYLHGYASPAVHSNPFLTIFRPRFGFLHDLGTRQPIRPGSCPVLLPLGKDPGLGVRSARVPIIRDHNVYLVPGEIGLAARIYSFLALPRSA